MYSCVLLALLPLVEPVPSPAEVARLSAFVGNLNHPRYVVREQASKRLVEAGGTAKGVLRSAATSGDPETAARAKAALEAVLGAEVAALRPYPEIDAAWRDTDAHVYAWGSAPPVMYRLLQTSLSTPAPPGPWSAYYRACEWWARERLNEGMSPRLLRIVLADMHRKDADFLGRAGDVGEDMIVDHTEYLRGGK